MHSRVSFAGMTLDKCIASDRDVNWMSTVQGDHQLCRLKNPTVISIWLLVGFHPATWSVQSAPADNTPKRVWQYIEKEKKKTTNESQEVSPFPAGDHKAHINSCTKAYQTQDRKNIKGPQKNRLGTVSKIFYWRA